MLDNLRFIFYTNENNLDLVNLTLKYFFKHTTTFEPKVTVVSNKIKPETTLLTEKINYLQGNVEFQYNGGHFSKTLFNTLPYIQEEYVFFFCDDYFLIDELKVQDLVNTLKFIESENIDYFGFDDIAGEEIYSFLPYKTDMYLFNRDNLFYRDSNYRYVFSVQPSIWKKDSLFQLTKLFPNMSLHNLDETLPEIKKANSFKCVCNTNNSHFSYIPLHKDYLIIAYIEAIRHGVFHYPENGFYLSPDYTSVRFIEQIIEEEKLKEDSNFTKFFIHAN